MTTPAAKNTPAADIRRDFQHLADDVLLDDAQIAALSGFSIPTHKRWRAEGKGPAFIRLNGHPRSTVGAVRNWLASAKK